MQPRIKKLLFVSLILVIIGITVLSLLPPRSAPDMHTNDKVGHFIAYAVLSLNFGLWINHIKAHAKYLILLISYGALMEFLQGFVPGRDQSFLDMLANASGVIIGFGINYLVQLFRKTNGDKTVNQF